MASLIRSQESIIYKNYDFLLILSALNFFLKAILICCYRQEIFKGCVSSQGVTTFLCILVAKHNHVVSFVGI
jgi:hypothetical protein